MKIPKSFKLGAIEWEVKEASSLPNAFGVTYQATAHIDLLKELKPQIKQQTFCHELVHAILFSMGKPASEHDEVFVDGFATMLHQYLDTAK